MCRISIARPASSVAPRVSADCRLDTRKLVTYDACDLSLFSYSSIPAYQKSNSRSHVNDLKTLMPSQTRALTRQTPSALFNHPQTVRYGLSSVRRAAQGAQLPLQTWFACRKPFLRFRLAVVLTPVVSLRLTTQDTAERALIRYAHRSWQITVPLTVGRRCCHWCRC